MKLDTNELYDYKTEATINISKSREYPNNFNCWKVAKFLLKENILSDVTTSTSIVGNIYKNENNKPSFAIEHGCKINIHGIKPKYIKSAVWAPLKYEFMLDCCNIKINTVQYHGCINNLF